MKIGLMNNPRLSVYKQVESIGKAGFDFVDLTIEGPLHSFDVDKVRALLVRYGLAVVGHTDPCLPWSYPIQSIRDACYEEMARCVGIFSRLGATIINIHPCYTCPPSMKQGLVEQNAEALGPLVSMAHDHGCTLVLENFRAPFDSVVVFQHLLKKVPGLQVHLDVGHTNMGQDSTQAFCDQLGTEIAHVHFSDNRGTDDHHMPLGAGNINWKDTVNALQGIGYDSTVTLEVFCGSDNVLFDYLETSRQYLKALGI